MSSRKLEGNKKFDVPVKEGFNRNIEVTANTYSEAVQKVTNAGHTPDPYRFGKEK